ncbi:MAG: hypothetical protein V8T62_06340 [Oscillospiraceae bacterium]
MTGPSPKCQEYFQQIGVKKDVNVIPNAVELDDFSPDRISAKTKLLSAAAIKFRTM